MTQNILDPGFYLSLVNHNCGLICVIDENGICKYVNQSFFDIAGYNQEELLGKLVLEYLHNDDIQAIKNSILLLKTYKTVEAPLFRFRTKSGNWKWLEAVITNSLDNENVNGYVIDARDVTLKQVVRKNLEKSHSFYSSFHKNHPDAVFTLSPDGLFEQANSKICHLLSYNKVDVIGEHFSKFVAPSFSFEANKSIIEAAGGKSATCEGKIINKNGKILTLRFTIIPIYNNHQVTAILCTAKDITAEKQALREIEKLSLIASRAVSCVMITDAEERIEWVNSEFTKVTGYTMRECLGKKPGSLLQGKETNPKTVLEMHKLIRSKSPFSVEVLNYKKNGAKFWFEMDIAPIFDDEGKISKFFAIQSDITERKKQENQTRQLAEDLTKRNRELQQFNFIVSHNLRAPVANIIGLISLLENATADKQTIKKAIEKIKETAHGLDNVIKDLDEILSMREDEEVGLHDIIYIKSVCEEVIHSMQDMIDKVGASVHISVPEEINVRANRAYIYSIFHNLLSNSLKYTKTNQSVSIFIEYKLEAGNHTIIFKDNGIGIDLDKYKDQVFKLYSRFDKNTNGRGLGLYMVKKQMEALGGDVDLESVPGSGTTFYLHFKKLSNTSNIPVNKAPVL
jgi:PAS domain S-box-containing protein